MERKQPVRATGTDGEHSPPRVPIGDRHKAALGTTLGMLDEMLCSFERWAHGQETQGVLYRESNRLTHRQRAGLRVSIRVIRQDLRTLLRELDLVVKVEDVRSAIWSQSSAFWEAIIELEPKYMRRYGELPQALAAYLDQRVSDLAKHLRELTDCLGKK